MVSVFRFFSSRKGRKEKAVSIEREREKKESVQFPHPIWLAEEKRKGERKRLVSW